ncbi:MAG: aminotransferase class I/II-fold pyridoxal phosphate-dependent enzyme, partial [Pseudomonadales bacterium]
GAYAEYVMKDDFSDGLAMVGEFDNVVVSRTFSKIYGLPGLRIGWMLCSEAVTSMVQRVRTPFNTNSAALAAATAAIKDQAYMYGVRDANADSLQILSKELSELGIEVVPSVANFYLLRFSADTGKSGSGAAECLLRNNIIPRPAGDSDEYLRITVGTAKENAAVMTALRDYMAG